MTDDSDRLPLDSPRWSRLWTRMGPGAYPVPQVLQALGDDRSDLELFREMWPEICSEETTYDAAFAAVPYLMDLAARLSTAEADEYLIVAGLIATYASDVPSDLEPAFGAAMQRGLTLALERLESCKTDAHLRYLLASVAAELPAVRSCRVPCGSAMPGHLSMRIEGVSAPSEATWCGPLAVEGMIAADSPLDRSADSASCPRASPFAATSGRSPRGG